MQVLDDINALEQVHSLGGIDGATGALWIIQHSKKAAH